jgi:Putative MetA-pathway of phenol degradation
MQGDTSMNSNCYFVAISISLFSLITSPAFAKQPLETETARLPEQGHGNVQFEFEYATSSEGHDIAVPLVVEYGITDRLKFVVEPDLYSSLNPKGGPSTNGFGDTEVRLIYLVSDETTSTPAFAIGAEVKVPTAKKPILGTGKLDYRVYGIASKRAGRFDLHTNLGYTVVSSPVGEGLPNIIDYSIAAEYEVSPKFTLVSEVIGNSPLGGKKSPIVQVAGEGEGTVVTGLIGGIYQISPRAEFALAGTYDSGSVLLIRTGLTFKF